MNNGFSISGPLQNMSSDERIEAGFDLLANIFNLNRLFHDDFKEAEAMFGIYMSIIEAGAQQLTETVAETVADPLNPKNRAQILGLAKEMVVEWTCPEDLKDFEHYFTKARKIAMKITEAKDIINSAEPKPRFDPAWMN